MIIGITGYKRCGKDTVAKILKNYSEVEVKNLSFAEALKNGASAMFGNEPSDKDKESCVYGFTFTWRSLYQTLGASIRNLDEDVWVKLAMSKIDPNCLNIFTDVRYPNEAKAIREKGGKIIKVERFENYDPHESETSVDLIDPDYIIDNRGDLQDLIEKVKSFLSK